MDIEDGTEEIYETNIDKRHGKRKMHRIDIIRLLIPVVIVSYIMTSVSVVTPVSEEQEIGTWEYNAVLILKIKKLFNNVWGAGNTEKDSGTLKSYIYYKLNGNFGWEWNRPSPIPVNGRMLPLYPAVIVKNTNNFSYFSKLKYINSLKTYIEYKYVKQPTGSYNFAYDVWFKEGEKRVIEIMIWMDCVSCTPGTYKGEINDGYNTYSIYYNPSNKNRPWIYYAFLLKNRHSSQTTHTANMKILLDKIVQLGDLSTEWDLYSIELGNEVWKGSGRTEIEKYIIDINGISVDITGDDVFVGPMPTQSPIATPDYPDSRKMNVSCYVITRNGGIVYKK